MNMSEFFKQNQESSGKEIFGGIQFERMFEGVSKISSYSNEKNIVDIKDFFGFQDYSKPEISSEEELNALFKLPQNLSKAQNTLVRESKNFELQTFKYQNRLSMQEGASTVHSEKTDNCRNCFSMLEQASTINFEVKQPEDSFKQFESLCKDFIKKTNNLNNDDPSQLSFVSNAASKTSTKVIYNSSCDYYYNRNEITQKELRSSSSHLDEAQKKTDEAIFFIQKTPKNYAFSASASYSSFDSLKTKKSKVLKYLLRRFPCISKIHEPLNSCLISTNKNRRKVKNDSINKKLKTNCLNFLSSLLAEKDLFSEQKSCSIEINKEFNRELISSIIYDALRKKYKKEDFIDSKLDEIKKKIDDSEFLSMTFAEFFDCLYLPSKNFEALLSKNSNDANYLIWLIKNAAGYVDYFEKEQGNKKSKGSKEKVNQRKKEKEAESESEAEKESN